MSQLPRSASEVLSTVYDPVNKALNTNANATIENVSLEVDFSAAAGDNTAIANQNGTRFLVINVDGSVNVLGPLTNTQLRASPVPVSVASLPLPSGASTDTLQTSANTLLSSIDTKLTSPLAVTGPLTDTQLRASDVPVTANAGTNLNTSLLALDSTVAKDSSLATLDTSINTLLKPASTLAAVTTLGTITNVVHVDDNSGSLTVDNAGTFPVQATLAAETTKVIGTVNQGTSPWVTAGQALALQLDNTSTANVTYVGKAAVGSATASAVWQIQKIDETTGLVITWAGSAAFSQIWNNRTSLSYT